MNSLVRGTAHIENLSEEQLAVQVDALIKADRRVETMLTELGRVWHKHPEWRLGQLLVNVTQRSFEAPFYFPDEDLLEDLREC